MIIQRVNRTNPEKVFIITRNDEGVTVPIGSPVNFKFDAVRDGLDVERAVTGGAVKTLLTAGLADAAIPTLQYGLVQCYGVRTDAVFLGTDSAQAVGNLLIITHASNALMSVTAGAATEWLPAFACGVAQATIAASTTTNTAVVFIRCM